MSREYRDWRDIAGWTIKAASLEGVPSPVCVTIRAAVPDRICGLDNILKPLLDALTVFGVIEDDSKAVRIVTEWSAEVENGTVLVGVRQFSAPDVRKRMSGAARRRWEVVRAASRDREMET
jgi:Holliday junction resolvase RusA-like endonuclease